jgi:hypothetical protein
MKHLFYFGCIGQAGHGWFLPGERRTHEENFFQHTFPGLNWRVIKMMDSSYCPGDTEVQAQGVYRESIIPPLRIIAWWDRSGPDTRKGCNSVLFGSGYVDGEEMLDDAARMFPSVMKRQPRPKPEAPLPALVGSHPVMLYFVTKQDADDFITCVHASKPNMKTRQL